MSLSGLLQAVLPDPALVKIAESVGSAGLELEGPTAVRPLVSNPSTASTRSRRPTRPKPPRPPTGPVARVCGAVLRASTRRRP